MGDIDDDFNELAEFVTMYQQGHTDGYTHMYGGPLYESPDAADFASHKQHGAYAVSAKALACIRLIRSGRIYIVDGPYKTFKDVEMEDEIRKAALSKLTVAEKRVLGIK